MGACGSVARVCGWSVPKPEPRDTAATSNKSPPAIIPAILPLDRFRFGGSIGGGAGYHPGGVVFGGGASVGFGGGVSVVLNVSSFLRVVEAPFGPRSSLGWQRRDVSTFGEQWAQLINRVAIGRLLPLKEDAQSVSVGGALSAAACPGAVLGWGGPRIVRECPAALHIHSLTYGLSHDRLADRHGIRTSNRARASFI
jgi:hypothetical protein